ncbi:hypothetical protein SPIRO4BDMA_50465 [uncultured spirochete]|jgi:hypothetical protein|uniref:Squalene cyclase C-terminal domain-containing protein n=1 Tax=uncultured spirochete TaxID=156406 RepID=A0A3P3XRT3_9SPIR|nr:hypothetical protein SPIRO4BDMA_50465 [uncultured spirochete]
MINIDTAEGFIRKNGTEIERARLSSILGSMFDTQKALSLIQSLQNKDGGFSLVKDRESNISDTGFILTWLSDLKALHSNIAEKAIVYLESLQNKNGSWNETLPTDDTETPEWQKPENHRAMLFHTANTLFWLNKYSRNSICIEKGKRFLNENYKSEQEYIHTKWLFASIMSEKHSWRSSIIREIVKEIYEEITPEMPSSILTWMLCAFSVYEIPRDMEYIPAMMRQIHQEGDGSIESEDDDSYKVNATLEAVKVYKYYIE